MNHNSSSDEMLNDVYRNVDDMLDTAQLFHRAGDLPKAEDIYLQVLKQDPTNANAHHLLGLIALQVGKNEISQHLIQTAIDLDDSQPLYHANLGAAYYADQQFDRAEAAFQQALELDPEYYDSYLNYGITLKHQTKLDESVEALDKAVQLNPNDSKPFAHLADVLVKLQRFDEAENIATAAAKLGPEDSDTLFALISAYEGIGRPREAIEWCQTLVDRQPTNQLYYLKLATLCQEAGLSQLAQQSARRALYMNPDNPVAYKVLSAALMSFTDWDEALQVINQGVDKYPDNVALMAQKAGALERKGLLKEAYEIVRPMILKGQFPIQALLVFTSIARKYGAQHEAAAMLNAQLNNPNLPEGMKQGLLFQAGVLFNDVKDYDKAFKAYEEGNRRKKREYNKTISEQHFQQLKTIFSQELLETIPKSPMDSRRPIFIVGMPRSGTSLTEQILASHPDVYGAGELEQMGAVTRWLAAEGGGLQSCLERFSEETADIAAQMYLDRLDELNDSTPRVTDKMPQNFLNLGLISILFPRAAIIHCRRDPRDTCISCYFQNFSAAGLSFAYDLEDLGHYYNLYLDLMEHWHHALPSTIYESRYEELVSNPEDKVRDLLNFCNLEWDPACLEFYKSKRDMKTASYDQVRQPIYKSSSKRWKKYEKHIQPLIRSLGEKALQGY